MPRPTAAAQAEASNEPDNVLVNKLYFGMAKTAALKLPGARPGDGEFAGEIILPEFQFASLPWTARLIFNLRQTNHGIPQKDGASAEILTRVCLAERFAKSRLEAVNAYLRRHGFEMLAMQADGKKLDFLPILKAFGPQELQNRIASLYQRDDLSLMTFAWFDTRELSREMKALTRNLNELLHVAAADTREVEVSVRGENGKMTHLLLIFSLPILEIQTFGTSD